MDGMLTHGLGVKLTHAEYRRLEELAKQTGRSKNNPIRRFIRLASPRDGQVMELVRNEYKRIQKEKEAYENGL